MSKLITGSIANYLINQMMHFECVLQRSGGTSRLLRNHIFSQRQLGFGIQFTAQ